MCTLYTSSRENKIKEAENIKCLVNMAIFIKAEYMSSYDPVIPLSAYMYALKLMQKDVHNSLICISQTLNKRIMPI